MLDSYKCILDLMSFTLNNKPFPDSYKLEVTLEEVFKIAAEQDICPLLYKLVERLQVTTSADSSYKKSWKNVVLFSCLSQFGISNDLKRLHETFDKEKIPAVFLKGIVLKKLYPQPELRCMRDIDIFVEPGKVDDATAVLAQLGYKVKDGEKEDHDGLHIVFIKDNSLSVELHYSLLHKAFMGRVNIDFWYEHIWSNIRTMEFEGTNFNVLSYDDEFINLIIHFATHMVYSGASLKQLYDILIFVNTYSSSMDWNYICYALNNIGLLTFAKILLTACRDIIGFNSPVFFEKQPTELSETLFDDIFSIRLLSEKNREHECWRDFMLRYKFTRNHPRLIPVSLVLETGLQIVRFRNSPIKSVLWSKNTFLFVKKRFKLLKSIGISN
ncbi:MAG TPA: nucleotidyltransferase family protein [Clostridia bacterium]